MRITKISVTGLFGQYDHTIPLNQEDRITIIHGPNGVGKTILLRMIHGLLMANFDVFRRIPFREFRVDLDDGQYLAVTTGRAPIPDGEFTRDLPYLLADYMQDGCQGCVTVTGAGPEQRFDSVAYLDKHTDPYVANEDIEENAVEALMKASPATWTVVPRCDETLTLEQVEERYGYLLDDYYLSGPDWFLEIIHRTPTLILRTDRLVAVTGRPNVFLGGLRSARHPGTRDVFFTPLECSSRQVAGDIAQVIDREAKVASELARTFPARLVARLSSTGEPAPAAGELRTALAEMDSLRIRLSKVGLLTPELKTALGVGPVETAARALHLAPLEDVAATMSDSSDTGESGRRILSLYLDDTRRGLEHYEPLLSKLELLFRIANRRLAVSSKRLRVGSKGGLVIHTLNGEIPPERLSSGEQHQLVLFFTLLFDTVPGTLVLIDEPELSMHIAWQQKFLKDLAAVAKVTDLQFLIATHSPDIIYDRWDLTVELKGSGPDEEEH
jgi:energy-coupling factor transporter ATP-binding protein EcfA2